MRQLLQNNRLMPFYGVFIRFCYAVGFTAPIVWLTLYFMKFDPKIRKTGKITIFALGSTRFRGDLEVLAGTGKFQAVSLPDGWQNRIVYSFFRIAPTFEAVFHPDTQQQKDHDRLQGFMQAFLPKLYAKIGADVVINAATHYQNDYLWGVNSSRVGVPFVIFHRECFHTTKERREFWVKRWAPAVGKYHFDFCIFHNETIRKNYADSGVFPLEKTAAAGTLRMDEFVRQYYRKPVPLPQKKQVVLFSFHHCVGLGGSVPLWSPYDAPCGYTQMFEAVHVAFARYAAAHPDVSCVLKPKWGGVWINEFHKVFSRNNIDISKIPNLKIIEKVDVHKLIEETSVVCSYGSTTLLEAGLMGRPVVITLMGEGLRPDYQDQVQMKDDFGFYDVARSEKELFDLIDKNLENPAVPPDIQAGREQLFDKWISPIKADAVERYVGVLEEQAKKAKRKQ